MKITPPNDAFSMFTVITKIDAKPTMAHFAPWHIVAVASQGQHLIIAQGGDPSIFECGSVEQADEFAADIATWVEDCRRPRK